MLYDLNSKVLKPFGDPQENAQDHVIHPPPWHAPVQLIITVGDVVDKVAPAIWEHHFVGDCIFLI
jgi:hypothetical protein